MRSKFSQQFQTVVLVTLVALLCLSMIGAFNNQMEGCASGGRSFAVRVYGDNLSERDFDAIYRMASFNRYPLERQRSMDLRRAVANGLVDRTLLTREARDLGMEVDSDALMQRFVREGTVRLTLGLDAPQYQPQGALSMGGEREMRVRFTDDDGNYDVRYAEQYIRNGLGLSLGEFEAWQTEEELAHRVRALVTASVNVSPAEVWATYEREQERASIAYFRFSPGHYRQTLEVDEAALSAWMTAHSEEVNREFEQNRSQYTDLPEQVRARHILLRVASTASDEEKAEARSRMEDILRQARAPGADFEALAREHSDDSTASRGGDLGYNQRGRMVRAFDEAQFTLQPGQISDIVETQFGLHIIQVVDKREGDVPEDVAKREIGERLYRESRADELAQQEAARILADLRGGATPEAIDRQLMGLPAEPPVDEEGNPVEEETPDRGALAPALRTAVRFDRTSNPIRGLEAAPLVRAVFDMEEGATLPEEPLRLGSEYVVFQLTDRTHASRDDFDDETQERIRQGLLRNKQREALRLHMMQLRERAEGANAISIRTSLLSYGDEADAEESDSSSSSMSASSDDS